MTLLYSNRVTATWDEIQTVLQTSGPAGLKEFLIDRADSRIQDYARNGYRIDTAPGNVVVSYPSNHAATIIDFRLEVKKT